MGKDVEELIQRRALQNAILYGGTAKVRSVIGKVLADQPNLKPNVRELIQVAERITGEVNLLLLNEQKKLLERKWPKTTIQKITPDEKPLPPLPNAEKYAFIHVRFCPNPDGALHLGGARAAILCDEYAKIYDGQLTLRFDDTDPRTKSPIPEAYDWITSDLKWLGVKWHNQVYQSDRLEIYYGYAEKLIEMDVAYVCTCKPKDFRKRVLVHEACPCRELPAEEHLTRWAGMLNGFFDEGEAVVRVKTDLNHPNPAVREWPALRIIDTYKFPHPRSRDKYRVWPLFAFCCGIDDHDLQISHIIRGKEHLTNTVRQLFLYTYLHWEYPDAIHYGRFKIVGSVLSKSKIRDGIAQGLYKGWDDSRLGTLMALRKRGFLPKTVRQLILTVGPKPVDVTVSWENIQALNRKFLDSTANRFFFVANPLKLVIHNVKKFFVSDIALHPNAPERGTRSLKVIPKGDVVLLLISKNDLKVLVPGNIVRLMELFNIALKRIGQWIEADFHSESYTVAKQVSAPLIHWLPHGTGVATSVVMPDTSIVNGIAEDSCRMLKSKAIIQFERFGFVRLDTVSKDKIIAYYGHR